MAYAGSQQLRAQDLGPARRHGTDGNTGHQDRAGGNGERKSDGSEDVREYECRAQQESMDGSGNGSGNGPENGAIIEVRVEGRRSLRIYEVGIEVVRKPRDGGRRQRETRNQKPETAAARPDSSVRPSNHAEDESLGTGDKGHDREHWIRET